MRTYFYYAALATMGLSFMFNSCKSNKQEKQLERYDDAFMKYVRTDFDDPNDFLSITEIEVKDTLKPEDGLQTLEKMEELFRLIRPSKIDEIERIRDGFNHEVGLVNFRLKARVRVGENKRVFVYYGLEDLKNGKITYRERKIGLDDSCVPKCYRDMLDLGKEVFE